LTKQPLWVSGPRRNDDLYSQNALQGGDKRTGQFRTILPVRAKFHPNNNGERNFIRREPAPNSHFVYIAPCQHEKIRMTKLNHGPKTRLGNSYCDPQQKLLNKGCLDNAVLTECFPQASSNTSPAANSRNVFPDKNY